MKHLPSLYLFMLLLLLSLFTSGQSLAAFPQGAGYQPYGYPAYQQPAQGPYSYAYPPRESYSRGGAAPPWGGYPPARWQDRPPRQGGAVASPMRSPLPTYQQDIVPSVENSKSAPGKPLADVRILLISDTMGRITQRQKLEKISKAAQQAGFPLDYRFEDEIEAPDMARLMQDYSIVLFDALNGETGVKAMVKKFRDALANARSGQIVLPLHLENNKRYLHGVEMADAGQLMAYMEHGGMDNFQRFFRYLAVHVLGRQRGDVLPPLIVPDTGIYHPQAPSRVFSNPNDYLSWYRSHKGLAPDENIPVVGIAFHRAHIAADSMKPVLEAIRQVESAGALPYAFYAGVEWEEGDYRRLTTLAGKPLVDVILNFQIMILEADDYRAELEAIGVQVLHALAYRQGDADDWRNDTTGIHFSSIPMYLTIPETIGFVDPLVVTALNKKTQELEPIDSQFKSLVDKAIKTARLRHLAPAQKRLALFYYNYPPGVTNVAAAFLNLPESLVNTLSEMQAQGYDTGKWDVETLTEKMKTSLQVFYYPDKKEALANEGQAVLLPLDEYQRWFAGLPPEVQSRIDTRWGKAEQSLMLVDNGGKPAFVIPAIRSGKILLLPQPPRGEGGKDEKSLYHDTGTPPSHSYLATYLYIRDNYKADALVHFGTHGTQEWTPGKERGLSVFDDPYLIVGDIPVFYPYLTNNLAEGMQARRRGRATLISHQTPPFAVTGTHGEMSDIQRLLNEYNGDAVEAVREKARQQLIDKVLATNIHKDMDWEEAKLRNAFDQFSVQLNDYLLGLSNQAQPLGMHSFGTVPKREHLISTLALMLGKEYRDHADGKDAAAARDFSAFTESRSYRLIEDYVLEGEDLQQLRDQELKAHMESGRDYLQRFRAQAEIKNLLLALAGGFIATSVGGDPVRSPDSLPTGRNLYAFDPSKVPTRAAWETGKQLLEQSISDYRQRHGRYPRKFTFSLWSLETMRHLGAMEAQILWALGVRPVWDKYDRFDGIEVIEASELGRPRLDIVVSATGLYRDAFPNVMKRIAAAVDRIARLKEDNNFAFRHARQLKQSLIEQGISPQDADRLSTVRVFSNAGGAYGNGLKDTTLASDTWDDEGKLAQNFLRNLGHYYGAEEGDWGKRLPDVDLFSMNLSGTDSVIFSRTSNLYGLLTSDDPFGFFGGLGLAIRHIDGRNPEMQIANLRDPDNPRNESTARFMAKELRGRYFHPQWVTAMQEEGYSGTLGVLDVVNNFWGWQVVDPDAVRDDQWQEFVDVYVNDKLELGVNEWFEQHNPQAMAQIIERMLEAVRKEYWQADASTVQQLVQRYEELRQQYPVVSSNEKFNAFLDAKLSGYGLSAAAPQAAAQQQPLPQNQLPAQQMQEVQGQRLEKVSGETADLQLEWLAWLALLLGVSALGYFREQGSFSVRWAGGS